jgi:tRNA 2-thiouridine synthesizing protein C
MESVLVLLRTSPYGNVSNGEGFRICIGLAACDIAVEAVLMDDGVYAALKGQKPNKIGMSSLERAYGGIKENFNVPLFVHQESMERRKISAGELIAAQEITTAEIRGKIAEAKAVLTF